MKLKLPLRDLFWLVLVVAIGLGWWANASRLMKENDQLRQIAQDETNGFKFLALIEWLQSNGYQVELTDDAIRVSGKNKGSIFARRGRGIP